MDWLSASIGATIVVSGAPLLLGEVFARAGGGWPEGGQRSRRALWAATGAVWLAFGLWFLLDRPAVAAGERPFAVAIANLLAFAFLFFAFAARAFSLDHRQREGATPAESPPVSSAPADHLAPSELRAARTFVSFALLLGAALLFTSDNDIGYRLKGALMQGAGAAFFLLVLHRMRQPASDPSRPLAIGTLLSALGYFTVFLTAAVLTLTLDWETRSHRWLGVGSQLASGVLGLIACARFLRADLSR